MTYEEALKEALEKQIKKNRESRGCNYEKKWKSDVFKFR